MTIEGWNYRKHPGPNPLEEPDILVYDPISHTKLLVTLEELKKNQRDYIHFKVYEGISGNKKVYEWLKEHEDKV